MALLAGAFVCGALLLIGGGVAKLVDPRPLARALGALAAGAVPVTPVTVRVIAAAEIAVGAGALVTGGRVAAGLLTISYAAFTAVVFAALSGGGAVSSCGCFGKADTPATGLHVAVTAALAGAAAVAVVRPPGPVHLLVTTHGSGGAAFVVATAALTAVAYLALAVHPALVAARHLATRP